MGHVFGDADAYMNDGEKAAAMAVDPVPRYRQRLIDAGAATDGELLAVEAQIAAELDEAVRFALQSPPPGLEELAHDVYAEEQA